MKWHVAGDGRIAVSTLAAVDNVTLHATGAVLAAGAAGDRPVAITRTALWLLAFGRPERWRSCTPVGFGGGDGDDPWLRVNVEAVPPVLGIGAEAICHLVTLPVAGCVATEANRDPGRGPRSTGLLRFTITVTSEPPPGPEPLAFVGTIADQHDYVVGADVRITLPEARGGTPPLVRRVISRPPAPWLSFAESTRVVWGKPTEPDEYRLTYEVTDANRQQIQLQFTVTVTERTDPARFIAVAWEDRELSLSHSRECTQRVWTTARGRYYDGVREEAKRKCVEKIPAGDGDVFYCRAEIVGSDTSLATTVRSLCICKFLEDR